MPSFVSTTTSRKPISGFTLPRSWHSISAVCLILAALLEPARVLAQEPAVHMIFRRIHRDEARHVRLSRRIAGELVQGDVIGAVAENARLGLVGVLARRGAAFDILGVNAERLFARIGSVPNGLFQ